LLDIESVDSVTIPVKDEKRNSNGSTNSSTGNNSGMDKNGGQSTIPEPPQFGLRWKIFELDGCEGAGKACLVFPPKSEGVRVISNSV
jgi:tubulin polyglutamylase complex subunit 2